MEKNQMPIFVSVSPLDYTNTKLSISVQHESYIKGKFC